MEQNMEQRQAANFNLDAINELLEGDNSNRIFYKYKSPGEIGEKILDEVYARFDFEKGFRMDDSSKDVGLLSQCQSLQALLLLTSDFSLKFDREDYFKDGRTFSDGTKPTIRRIMDSVIEDIIHRIIRYNGKKIQNINDLENDNLPDGFLDKVTYCFDASPYDSSSFTAEYSYIDAITWVIPIFLLVLKYHATKEDGVEDCKWEKCLVAIIKHGMKYLNESFIINEEIEGRLDNSQKLEIGWNFTKDCEEPSLYFTFAVAECCVDFYETFKHHIDYQNALRRERMGLDMPKEILAAQKNYDKSKSELKLRELFIAINGAAHTHSVGENGEEVASTPYAKLEGFCKKTANKIWKLSRNELADKFFYNDLGRTLNEDVIKMSTTSDALFNSVYIVNILLDAGVDEDIELQMELADMSGRIADKNKYQEEYDDLLEVCQLAIQKAMRTYEKLKKESKEYIVDQFLVGFNETFKLHNDLIKDLRKRRIRVFSLAPLLIHSNNVIGRYLVRYPQYNMKKYLGYILENRLSESKNGVTKTKWIWESDGFFSASNYYFIAALGEFYDYYDSFEKIFIDVSDEKEETAKEIRAKYKKELDEFGDIADLNHKIEQKDRRIEELEAIERPVEKAVQELVEQTLKEKLSEILCEVLKNENLALKQRTALKLGTPNRTMTELAKALDSMLLEIIAFDGAVDGKTLRDDTHKDARTLIKDEVCRVRERFANAIMFSDDNKSGFYEE